MDSLVTSDDPVLTSLREAEDRYRAKVRAFQTDWVRHQTELSAAQAEAAQAVSIAARHRDRANKLAEVLKDIHRSLFNGNVYELILRACLTLTGASRGLYITTQSQEDTPYIRAAIDVDGYPQAPPSDFLRALCAKVFQDADTVVANAPSDVPNLPVPSPEENFHNYLAAPVVLMKSLNGIVIAADKKEGDFSADDEQVLLSIGDQASIAVENVQLQRKLQNAYLSTVSVLADAMEAKDPYTQGHCEMVSHYARLIGERLGLTSEEQRIVNYAALLHDIGKIGVSDGILNKPGPLLLEERDLVRSHVRIGHDLIRHVPVLDAVAEIVLHHHEWYDGTGYPDGLKGTEIPIAARIVCVVDAYCAMITKRSYKEAYPEQRVRDEMQRCAGSQFDPRVVEIFMELLDSPSHWTDSVDSSEHALLPGFDRLAQPL